MSKVITINGNEIDFAAAAHMMDDEIREELAAEGFETDQEFFEEYAKRHAEKFDGEQFAPYYDLAW